MSPDKLIRAIQADVSMLTGINKWLDEERQKAMERLARAEGTEVYRIQGEARAINTLKFELKRLARLRDGDEVDEQRTGKNGSGIPRGL